MTTPSVFPIFTKADGVGGFAGVSDGSGNDNPFMVIDSQCSGYFLMGKG